MNHLASYAKWVLPLMFVVLEEGNIHAIAQEKASSPQSKSIPSEIDSLLRLVVNKDKELADRVPVALKELAEREKALHDVLPALVAALNDKDVDIRCASVYVIGFLAPTQKNTSADGGEVD